MLAVVAVGHIVISGDVAAIIDQEKQKQVFVQDFGKYSRKSFNRSKVQLG